MVFAYECSQELLVYSVKYVRLNDVSHIARLKWMCTFLVEVTVQLAESLFGVDPSRLLSFLLFAQVHASCALNHSFDQVHMDNAYQVGLLFLCC